MAKGKKVENLSLEEKLEQALVPKNEQPYEIPDNWCWTRIENINFYNEKIINPSNDEYSLYELYSVPSMENNYPEIIKGHDIKSSKQSVKAGDVLLCKINPRINRVWHVNEYTSNILLASSEWIVVRNNKINSKYLSWCLQSKYFREFMLSKVSGVGGSLMRAQPKYVKKYPIPLAPINEQQRIVEQIENLFSKLDEAKEKIQAVIDESENRKAAILHKAFSGELTKKWRKENDINLSSWSNCKLKDTGQWERGRSKHRPRNDKRLFGGQYPFIQTGDIANAGMYIVSHMQTLSDFGLEQSRLFPKGTLCITIAANIGDVAILSYDCCFPDSVVGYTPYEGFDTKYMYYFLSNIQNELEYIAPATAQKNLNLKLLKNVDVTIPKIKEQQEMVNKLETLLNNEEHVSEKAKVANEQIGAMKKSILNKAFRGELGTNDSSEPSSIELLKEILQ